MNNPCADVGAANVNGDDRVVSLENPEALAEVPREALLHQDRCGSSLSQP
jgi:hypothetical protein